MTDSTRRQFLATAAAGAVVLSGEALGAAPATSSQADKSMPKLIHHVFFWLKNPESKADRDQLIAGIKTLAAIETVRSFHVGVPASTEARDVVDHSYQVSEILGFDDVEGQNVYQVHPLHDAFVKAHSHLWEKVVVYDTIAG